MGTDKWKNWIWPPVESIANARQASRQGVWAAVFAAGATILLVVISVFGTKILDIDLWSLIDAAAFAIIAFGIFKLSRTAAVAGLSIYLIELAYGWATYGIPRSPIVAIIIILMFTNSVRGTFAYHKLVKTHG